MSPPLCPLWATIPGPCPPCAAIPVPCPLCAAIPAALSPLSPVSLCPCILPLLLSRCPPCAAIPAPHVHCALPPRVSSCVANAALCPSCAAIPPARVPVPPSPCPPLCCHPRVPLVLPSLLPRVPLSPSPRAPARRFRIPPISLLLPVSPPLSTCPRPAMAPLADLYQVSMAYGHWRAGRHRAPAAAELFFRRPPFRGSFALGAGLAEGLRGLRAFRFSAADVAYLRSVLPSTIDDAFFDYLATLDASEVTVTAFPEGSVVFARVPFLQVKGPLLVVQLLETTLLCLINYASLVATNAARFRLLAGPDTKLIEMGLRRAQGPDGALSASKYSYIGGFDCTSNILAGKLYGIPVRGTIAHSFIMSFRCLEEVQPRELPPRAGGDPVDLAGLAVSWLQRVCDLLQTPPSKANQGELAAFVSYAVTFPCDFQGLLDTYCVRRSGLPNFCAVALALHQLGYQAIGVRLDSGDLAQQSKEIRGVFQTCGAHFQVPWFGTIPIAVSNDISEQSLEEFRREGSEIDMIGIGTNLVTCPLQPSLGCVYKLVEVNGSPCLKLTEDEEKMTIPGMKAIYRLYDAAGHPFMDLMALEEEPSPSAGQELGIRVLGRLEETTKVCEPLPSLPEVRTHAQVSLNLLSPAHRRLHEPQPYPVAVTERLHQLFLELRQGSL
ncbi:nicotinate phosphoribosyltransferase isoform X2 [Serinus canaria]|uniref:nicotinate phosphoribosyltransferase isoform X2 n=1 Tax=Serinus canaria TaxID=9135 RepID=UPI0021CD0C95|nr:nicotinate phosphoribosyltransferase isoform X2 [Serinus canaria]